LVILLIGLSYLSGSIPFGWITVKRLTGVDLRKVGSGATGATNVYRVLKGIIGAHKALFWALFAGLSDILKALLPTLLIAHLYPDRQWLHLLVGASVVLGHTKPAFLGFHGGKAVSVSLGALLALAFNEPNIWLVLAIALTVFCGAVVLTGFVSVGSLSGSLVGALASIIFRIIGLLSSWYVLGMVIAAAYIWLMHKENIARLRRREELSTGREILERVIGPVARLFGRWG